MEPLSRAISKVLQSSLAKTGQESMMESYRAVELTPDEEDAALLSAKIKKYWQLHDLKVANEKIRQRAELTRAWTGREMHEHALARGNELVKLSLHPEYILDEYKKPVWKKLVDYFTDNERFLSYDEDYSLQKGLLLVGGVGVGKTDMLRSFEFNRKRCFVTITADEISRKVKENGADYWNVYTGFVPGHGSSPYYFMQDNIGWMIDDIGTEQKVVDYGTPVDPIEKILAARALLKGKVPYTSLHATTNLGWDDIENRYGYRTRSRIRELFNVIILDGEDMRR